ncbi:MAG: PAS domain S-box protein [Ginsengibacter sp.]
MQVSQSKLKASPADAETYLAIVESISDCIIAIDHQWRYVFINDRAMQYLIKESSESLIGKNIWETFDQIISQEFRDACEKVVAEQRYIYLEEYFPKYDIWIENHFYPSATGLTINFRDVTERKTREEEANKLSHRNTTIIEKMRENFMLTDEDMNIVDANPSFCEGTGYSKEELLKMNVSQFYTHLDKKTVQENFKNAVKSRQLLIDTKIKKKSGELADVEVTHAEMIIDNRHYIATFARDISAFKKAEEEIKNSNNRFELIGSITQDAVWEIELQSGKRWANEMHQLMYGLQKTDPVPNSQSWEERIHPEGREKIIKSLAKAMKDKKNQWISYYWFKTENKGWVYIYDRTYIVHDENRKGTRMLGSMLDITELKKAQEQIASEKLFSDTIINSLPGIVYLYDNDGKFLRWNKNFEAVSGYSSKEIAGMHPLEFYDENEKDMIRKKIDIVFETGSGEIEANFFTKDKKKIPYYFTGLITYINGVKCLIGTGIDMTEIKKAESRVDAMKQEILEQKVEEQKRISRAIINTQEKERDHIGRELHDNVNQILASTRLYLSMASKKDSASMELIKFPMELVDSSITEIRLLTHKHATPPKDIDLKDLIQNLLNHLSKTTEIKTNLEYDVSRQIIDEDLKTNIYRIIQEQINNITRHANPKNASITISADSEMIHLIIKDDGKGFDVSQPKDGIGISNITNRVNSFNGNIKIESSPGKGCSMIINIPY